MLVSRCHPALAGGKDDSFHPWVCRHHSLHQFVGGGDASFYADQPNTAVHRPQVGFQRFVQRGRDAHSPKVGFRKCLTQTIVKGAWTSRYKRCTHSSGPRPGKGLRPCVTRGIVRLSRTHELEIHSNYFTWWASSYLILFSKPPGRICQRINRLLPLDMNRQSFEGARNDCPKGVCQGSRPWRLGAKSDSA